MNVTSEEIFLNLKSLRFIQIEESNEQQFKIKTPFILGNRKEFSLQLNKENDSNDWVLNDEGNILSAVSTLIPEDLKDTTLDEFEFSAIRLGFDVENSVVSRTIRTNEELSSAFFSLIQWSLESNGILNKICSIQEDAIRTYGVNWTGDKSLFEQEQED